MGPDLENKGKSKVMPDASASKEIGVISTDSQFQNKLLKCKTNSEDMTFKMDKSIAQPLVASKSSEMDVKLTDVEFFRSVVLGKVEAKDETECSSSFDDSDSGIENCVSDSEAVSCVHNDSTTDLAFDGFGDFLKMRRRKLTPHWRTFIQPLAWRCKWLELQIRKCNAQSLKYDRVLAAYNSKKHFPSDNFIKEGFCVKSLPFSCEAPRDHMNMRRKKRRKIENMEDSMLYMSNHNVFSYEGKHDRAANGARMDDDLAIQEKIIGDHEPEVDDRFWVQSGDGNALLEGMLRKLGSLQSKLNSLKGRMNKVTSENAEKFYLADESGLLEPSGLSSPVQSLASPPTSGERIPVQCPNIASELPWQNAMVSEGMTGCAASSNGDVSYLPGVVGSDDQPIVLAKCMNEYNGKLKEEVNNFEEAIIQPAIEMPQVAMNSSQGTFPTVLDEVDPLTADQPAPKTRSIAKLTAPNSSKKRGKRKARSSRWSRRLSG